MTTLFRLDASIRTQGAVTRAVADTLETDLRAAARRRLMLGLRTSPRARQPGAEVSPGPRKSG